MSVERSSKMRKELGAVKDSKIKTLGAENVKGLSLPSRMSKLSEKTE